MLDTSTSLNGEDAAIGLVYVGMASRSRMVRIDCQIVDYLAAYHRDRNSEGVMQTLGISPNTWSKLRKGEAIRESVAERLVRRAKLVCPEMHLDSSAAGNEQIISSVCLAIR